MIDTFTIKNARKRYKKHILRKAKNKQGTADVFRC